MEMVNTFRGATPAPELLGDSADVADALLTERIRSEKESFGALTKAVMASGRFLDPATGEFDQLAFFSEYEDQMPIHSAVYFADCCSKKCASANVEQLFSNAGTLLADFHSGALSPGMLEMYMFVRANWQYEFLRPTISEIVLAYEKSHSKNGRYDSDDGTSDGE